MSISLKFGPNLAQKSRLSGGTRDFDPVYPDGFSTYEIGFMEKIPINRKSPLSESRLTEIHCIAFQDRVRSTYVFTVGGTFSTNKCTIIDSTFSTHKWTQS